MKRTALVDFDVLVYRCGFAAQHNEYYVYDKERPDLGWIAMFPKKKDALTYIKDIPDLYIEHKLVVEPESHAIQNLRASMRALMTNTRSDNYLGYLTGEGNFREKIATIRPYKGNRDKNHRPVHYDTLRQYCELEYSAEIVNEQEADDALGIAQYSALCANRDTVICSIDKDLTMIPGRHYNVHSQELYWVTEAEAIKTFYTQLLTGDLTDNIVGVPKVGKATAAKILEHLTTEKEMYNAVREEYEKVYQEKAQEVLLENARLLWIRRKENELWTPPIE